jgi:hypothetical protein
MQIQNIIFYNQNTIGKLELDRYRTELSSKRFFQHNISEKDTESKSIQALKRRPMLSKTTR